MMGNWAETNLWKLVLQNGRKNTETLPKFSANDADFSVNAREVWSSFVDTDADRMTQVGMFSFKSFPVSFKGGFA